VLGVAPIGYAKHGEVSIAYRVVGEGPVDLLMVPGLVSHLDLQWTLPEIAAMFRRLGSFSRFIAFDKPGTGVSDPIAHVPTLEERMEDVHAVLDAAGSRRAALFGWSRRADELVVRRDLPGPSVGVSAVWDLGVQRHRPRLGHSRVQALFAGGSPRGDGRCGSGDGGVP
jgi:hypothetical protein